MAGTSTKKAATEKKTAAKKTEATTKKKSAATKTSATTTSATKRTATKKAVAQRTTAKKTTAKKTAAKSDPASASLRIDQKIAELGDWRGERLAWIRKLIHEADPEVLEEWKWMGTPVWSHEGMYVLVNAHKDKVKLTFCHGAQLEDHHRLFNAGLDGNKWRAIDLYDGDEIDAAKLKDLLREAVEYNQTHTVPKSRGSRA